MDQSLANDHRMDQPLENDHPDGQIVFVFVFDHDYFLFWLIFYENPFLRIMLALHEHLTSELVRSNYLESRASKIVSQGAKSRICHVGPQQNCENCQNKHKIKQSFVLVIFSPLDPN